jgi:hypothetical protein
MNVWEAQACWGDRTNADFAEASRCSKDLESWLLGKTGCMKIEELRRWKLTKASYGDGRHAKDDCKCVRCFSLRNLLRWDKYRGLPPVFTDAEILAGSGFSEIGVLREFILQKVDGPSFRGSGCSCNACLAGVRLLERDKLIGEPAEQPAPEPSSIILAMAGIGCTADTADTKQEHGKVFWALTEGDSPMIESERMNGSDEPELDESEYQDPEIAELEQQLQAMRRQERELRKLMQDCWTVLGTAMDDYDSGNDERRKKMQEKLGIIRKALFQPGCVQPLQLLAIQPDARYSHIKAALDEKYVKCGENAMARLNNLTEARAATTAVQIREFDNEE